MRKIYTLFLLVIMTSLSYGQIFITELADPEDMTTGRYVELFNAGDADVELTNYSIQRYTNGNTDPQAAVPLVGVIKAKGFYLIGRSGFETAYGFAPDLLLSSGGPADSNGDDQIQILDGDSNVIDIFGVPGEDGNGTCHEFLDGRAERAATVTSGNAGTWSEENWNTWTASSEITGCSNRVSDHAVTTTSGELDPGSWIGFTDVTVSFVEGSSFIAEDGGSIEVCVGINNPDPENDTTVEIAINESSTASNGSDYTTVNSPVTVSFSAGSSENQCITINIIDDSDIESAESIILDLQNPQGESNVFLGGISTHTVTIEASDMVCPNEGDIIFSEIMQNPNAVADNMGEWFEIHNTTSSDINLIGMDIVDDNHTLLEEGFSILDELILPANGYLLFANNGDASTNGGLPTPAHVYDPSLTLGNGEDGITIQCQGTIIDKVVWDGGTNFPDPSGISMSLMVDKLDFTSNDDGANWEESTFTYGDGDFGTPGARNDQALSNAENQVEGLSIYPNPVVYGSFVLTSKNFGDKEISIYNVLGKRVFRKTFDSKKIEVNTSSFDSGLYLVRVSEGANVSVGKLVIQ